VVLEKIWLFTTTGVEIVVMGCTCCENSLGARLVKVGLGVVVYLFAYQGF
jgi:hypothetical protein